MDYTKYGWWYTRGYRKPNASPKGESKLETTIKWFVAVTLGWMLGWLHCLMAMRP